MSRGRGHALASVLVLGTGCGVVFGVDNELPDAVPGVDTYDRCAPGLADDPLRYATIANPNVTLDVDGVPHAAPWSWDEARARCRVRGMDLAIFNDEHELGQAPEPSAWPYWIGERRGTDDAWTTVDQCPALTTGATAALPGCGIVRGPLAIDASSCDGTLPVDAFDTAVVLGALCETPRPETTACLGAEPTTHRYVLSSQPGSYATAQARCAEDGGHLVVFETYAEWKHVSALVNATATLQQPFWTGARFDAGTWVSDNACPAQYAWADEPPAPVAGDCTATAFLTDDDAPAPTTRLHGLAPTACTTALPALCELDR